MIKARLVVTPFDPTQDLLLMTGNNWDKGILPQFNKSTGTMWLNKIGGYIFVIVNYLPDPDRLPWQSYPHPCFITPITTPPITTLPHPFITFITTPPPPQHNPPQHNPLTPHRHGPHHQPRLDPRPPLHRLEVHRRQWPSERVSGVRGEWLSSSLHVAGQHTPSQYYF